MTKINKVEELTGSITPPKAYDPYQALASAIVEKAAKDLRKYYRRRYGAQDRIEEYQAAIAELTAAIAEADGEDERRLYTELAAARRMLTRARQMLTMAERGVDECEGFFVSDWCMMLSELDGAAMLDEIEREERIRHRKKVGACKSR